MSPSGLRGYAVAVLAALLAAAALLLVPRVAMAQQALRGVALVIGNGEYEHLAPLANPEADARAVEELLSDLGFETTLSSNRDARRLARDLEGFLDDAKGTDVAVLYYAGHGIEAGGENFLVPVDANLAALDASTGGLVPVSRIMAELRGAAGIAILLLDACRDSPFPPGAHVTLATGVVAPVGATGLSLAGARGAAPLAVASVGVAQDLGTVIGFAAEPGKIALDGAPGEHSPYAAALIRHLSALAGAEFGQVMRMVGEEVYLKTAGRQRPWINESLRRLLYFGQAPQAPSGDEGKILAERRQLLLTIAALPELQRQQVEQAAQSSSVPMDALYGMLRALGQDMPADPAALERLLAAQADRVGQIIAERAALGSTDSEIARLSGLADRAIAEGALAAAIDFVEQAKTRVGVLEQTVRAAEQDIRARRIEFAQVYARSADAYWLSANRIAAANDYARAFDQVRQWDDRLAWAYRRDEMLSWAFEGGYAADNAALERSISLGEDAVRLAAHLDAEARGQSFADLGQVLAILGQRQVGTATLELALDRMNDALAAYPPERHRERALVGNSIGGTLWTIAQRDRDISKLEKAVDAFRGSLEHIDRASDAKTWADTQSSLGGALYELGRFSGSRERIEEAQAHLELALQARSREETPREWAVAQSSLALSIAELGNVDRNLAALERAADLLRSALEEMPVERDVLARAEALHSLASILRDIGDIERRPEVYQEAVALLEAALALRTRETVPLQWATTQLDLAVTMERVAEGTAGADLDAALDRYRLALQVFNRDETPREWAHVLTNMGNVQASLGMAEKETGRLADAAQCYEAALTVMTSERDGERWAYNQYYLGSVLSEIGLRDGDIEAANGALVALDAAQSFFTRQRDPLQFAYIAVLRGKAAALVGEANRDRDMVAAAREALKTAQQIFRQQGIAGYDDYLSRALPYVEQLAKKLR